MNAVYLPLIGIGIVVAHGVAVAFQLYHSVWWLDIIMHIVGGVWLTLVWYTVCHLTKTASRLWSPWALLAVAFVTFTVWEVFGVYVEGGFRVDWLSDTSLDTVYGIVGMIVGYYMVKNIQRNVNV